MSNFNFEQPYVGFNAIIVNSKKNILMVKEADGPHKDKWNFPGGRWDQKETLVEGVVREVKEETGFNFQPTSIIGLYSKFRERPSFTVVALQLIFSGEISGKQEKIAEDISDIAFFSRKEIEGMDEDELFDIQYKTALNDFFSGKRYSLDLIKHATSTEPDFE